MRTTSLTLLTGLMLAAGCGGGGGGGAADAGPDVAPDMGCPVVENCLDADCDGYGEGTGCLGPDCDDSDPAVNPGATETCNNIDDNCDGATDEGVTQACYSGDAATRGVGACHDGTNYCFAGVFGPCIGEVVPSGESCNNVDDDCNSQTDDGLGNIDGNFVCGLGACETTVPACVAGVPQTCVAGTPGAETCGNFIDDDCNGAVDDLESCGCIHVSPNGLPTNTGGALDPLDSIDAAIGAAIASGDSRVCVAAGTGCDTVAATAVYAEALTMSDGISVLGGFEDVGWLRSANCTTEIQAQDDIGVLFPSSVSSSTSLDGFTVTALGGSESAAVTVQGSTGAVLTNDVITGAALGDTTYGVNVTGGGTPLIARSVIVGGDGATLSAGVRAYQSAPIVLDNCDTFAGTGECGLGACGGFAPQSTLRLLGHGNALDTDGDSLALLLQDSPNTYVGRSAMCGRYGVAAAAIRIVGDATGVVIQGNNIGATGGSASSRGIETEGCAGAAPRIVDNSNIAGSAGVVGAPGAGVWSAGDCHPVIEGNAGGFFVTILGGFGSNAAADGIYCGKSGDVASRCVIQGNTIAGVFGFGGAAPGGTGVRCDDGACARIEGNQIQAGGPATDVSGLVLGATGTLVAGNIITGGCAAGTSIGVDALGSFARIENNVLAAGTCNMATDAAATTFIALRATLTQGINEVDVDSNDILAGGNATTCTSLALAIDADAALTDAEARGIFRNNILLGGDCDTQVLFQEESALADPRIVENNDFWPDTVDAFYHDEAATDLTSIDAVNGLADTTAGGNISGDPMFVTPGTDLHLLTGSACVDTGTAVGAPATDIEGTVRPQGSGPDIGAYEFVP
jgi:putative metal-binding protein